MSDRQRYYLEQAKHARALASQMRRRDLEERVLDIARQWEALAVDAGEKAEDALERVH